MRMHLSVVVVVAVMVMTVSGVYAQLTQPPIPLYYDQMQFSTTSPTATRSAINAFTNPAMYQMLPGSEMQLFWSNSPTRFGDEVPWGVFLGGHNAGFGIQKPLSEIEPEDFLQRQ